MKNKFINAYLVRANRLPSKDNWEILEDIDQEKFDFSWHPDDSDPPYIYVWGNQWNVAEDKASVIYRVPGASEYKYMTGNAIRTPSLDNWLIPKNVDASEFDFSWEPNPSDPPMFYQFGTQHQKTGGPRYIHPDATPDSPVKYMDNMQVLALPSKDNWEILEDIYEDEFDFSWHPDDNDPPYIYVWGNQWNAAETKASVVYRVGSTTTYKYMEDHTIRKSCLSNWLIPDTIDASEFDFSWEPNPSDPPMFYQFGTQHQKTGGPRYIHPAATSDSPVKYMDVGERFAQLTLARKLKVGGIIVRNLRVFTVSYDGVPTDWYSIRGSDGTISQIALDEWLDSQVFRKIYPVADEENPVQPIKELSQDALINVITTMVEISQNDQGATMFITHSPCLDCAKAIYQTGITHVYYQEMYPCHKGIDFLEQCGIQVTHWNHDS